MLKNRTKEQIKSKFNISKTTLFNQTVIEKKTEENEITDAYIKNNLAIIDVPNYLEFPAFKNSKTLLICLFQIVTEGLTPFLLYLLHRGKTGSDLQFITMVSFDGGKHNEHLTEEAVDYMKGQLNDIGEISYAGFTETATNNILFLKYISPTNCHNFALPSDFYWATTHELVNLKTVMNIPIALSVTEFFIINTALLKLKDEHDITYETPVIGYYISKDREIYRERKIERYEKCYYFDINMPKEITNNNTIIRAALFLERIGFLNDNFDKCDSLVYNNKDKHYYLIKNYAQHIVLT